MRDDVRPPHDQSGLLHDEMPGCMARTAAAAWNRATEPDHVGSPGSRGSNRSRLANARHHAHIQLGPNRPERERRPRAEILPEELGPERCRVVGASTAEARRPRGFAVIKFKSWVKSADVLGAIANRHDDAHAA